MSERNCSEDKMVRDLIFIDFISHSATLAALYAISFMRSVDLIFQSSNRDASDDESLIT